MSQRHLWLGAAVLALTSAVPAMAQTSVPATQAADKCASMANLAIPGTRIHITSAKHIAASTGAATAPGAPATALPAHCRIEGLINERTGYKGKPYGIGFAIALPDDWSGRFLLQGGGGLNGSVGAPIGPVASGSKPALARGFAVISHDSGHKGAGFNQDFMEDQRANLDFAETSVRVVAEIGKSITAAYYGRPADHSYMTGCSTGGREGMLAVQRYPELFDGIIVGAPAMMAGYSNFGIAYSQIQFNQAAPRDKDGKAIVEKIFSAADRKTILDGMLAQCDALDGLKDGVIENVAACKFKPALLQCKGKAKLDNCLSAAQVGALDRAFAGPKDKAGYPAYFPVPFDTGIVETQGFIPGYLPTGKPGVFGPVSRDLTIDIDARLQDLRADFSEHLTDTNFWTNLNSFTGHGGKILFFHGVSDPWFSAYATLDYWHRAEKANGAVWADTSRFYMVPGMGHCGGGANTFDSFDLLTPLVNWVEQGTAPATVVASRRTPAPAQRPMCPYPAYPHYVGGDVDKAGSYECRKPAG
jgi:feruloyl esterase